MVEVVTTAVKVFPQADLIQALKKQNADDIFATRSKTEKAKKKEETVKENQLIEASISSRKLTVDNIPPDRGLDFQITINQNDWDTTRFQQQDRQNEFKKKRKYHPVDHPYTYVEATVSTNGVVFPLGWHSLKKLLWFFVESHPSISSLF